MTAKKALSLVPILLLASLVVGSSAYLTAKKMRPLSREEVAKIWIGLTEDEAYVVRLSLSPDGTGQAGYVYQDSEPKVERITSWNYSAPKIEIEMAGNYTFRKLEGKVIGTRMALKSSGQGWSSEVHLRLEEDLQGRWVRLKDAMRPTAPGDDRAEVRGSFDPGTGSPTPATRSSRPR